MAEPWPSLELGPLTDCSGSARRSATSTGKTRGRISCGDRRPSSRATIDRLLVGIDLRKDRETLERAYDDAAGVTARVRPEPAERGSTASSMRSFDLDGFRHEARYDEPSGSVVSHLESASSTQSVAIDALDLEVDFAAGERIHTEDSFKYSPDEIDASPRQAGAPLWRNASSTHGEALQP